MSAMRILLAEDQPENREMLARRLRRRGYEVLEAADGVEATDMALSERPDLVLMDISMPRRCGLEATREILTAAGAGAPVIVALTAHAMAPSETEALAAGCHGFATKPVDFPALLSLMEDLMARRRAGSVL